MVRTETAERVRVMNDLAASTKPQESCAGVWELGLFGDALSWNLDVVRLVSLTQPLPRPLSIRRIQQGQGGAPFLAGRKMQQRQSRRPPRVIKSVPSSPLPTASPTVCFRSRTLETANSLQVSTPEKSSKTNAVTLLANPKNGWRKPSW